MVTKKRAGKRKISKKISEGEIVSSQALMTEGVADTEIIAVVLLLVFLYPVGVIFMWIMMKSWPLWVKILLSLPFILILCLFVLAVFFMSVAPRQSLEQRYYFRRRMMQSYPKTTLLPSAELTLPLS